MALEDARGDLVDLRAVGDVADLPLAADLSGDPLELVGASGERGRSASRVACELACDRLADAGRGAGDHRDALPGHGRATLAD